MEERVLFLFDLDGTLISTGGAGVRSLKKAFLEVFGVVDALNDVDPSGKTDPAIFREVIQKRLKRDMTDEDYKKLVASYLLILKSEMEESPGYRVMPGIETFLSSVRNRPSVLLGLGTGNLEEGARIKLERSGLNPYFPFGGFGSDSEDRTRLLQIATQRAQVWARCSISPSRVFVVGDTFRDIRAAKKAGFRSIAVSTGPQTFQELQNEEPDFVVQDMRSGDELLYKIAHNALV